MVIVLIILLLVCIVFGGVYLYTNRETPAPAPAPVSELELEPAPVSELEPDSEPVHCEYTLGEWSECSAGCVNQSNKIYDDDGKRRARVLDYDPPSKGVRRRSMTITKEPKNGGKKCPESTSSLLRQACVGSYGVWKPWTQVQMGKCGNGQIQKKFDILYKGDDEGRSCSYQYPVENIKVACLERNSGDWRKDLRPDYGCWGKSPSDCYNFGSGYLTPGVCWPKGAENKSRRPGVEPDGKCPSGSANWDAYNP